MSKLNYTVTGKTLSEENTEPELSNEVKLSMQARLNNRLLNQQNRGGSEPMAQTQDGFGRTV